MALLDLLQQAAGVEISSHEMIINSSMASYHILQTKQARVVNSKCEFEIVKKYNVLFQHAKCSGEIQKFGDKAPNLNGNLLSLSSNNSCEFSSDEQNVVDIDLPFFKAHQKFCLLLKSHEDQFALVFAIYQDHDKTKISRLFPDEGSPNFLIKGGISPILTPLSSTPLPEQNISQEAFLILHSREPIIGNLILRKTSGYTATETISNSVDINIFDQRLGSLNLKNIGILILPFAVAN